MHNNWDFLVTFKYIYVSILQTTRCLYFFVSIFVAYAFRELSVIRCAGVVRDGFIQLYNQLTRLPNIITIRMMPTIRSFNTVLMRDVLSIWHLRGMEFVPSLSICLFFNEYAYTKQLAWELF